PLGLRVPARVRGRVPVAFGLRLAARRPGLHRRPVHAAHRGHRPPAPGRQAGMSEPIKRVGALLLPHGEALLEAWIDALVRSGAAGDEPARVQCTRVLDTVLQAMGQGTVHDLLAEESAAAQEAAHAGRSAKLSALAIGLFDRCCLPYLLEGCPDRESLAE